jgi:hypothetical protein
LCHGDSAISIVQLKLDTKIFTDGVLVGELEATMAKLKNKGINKLNIRSRKPASST